MIQEAGVIGQVREHWRQHRAPESTCAWCWLWGAYIRGDMRVLDELGDSEELGQAVTAIRAQWGEAGWTARDLVS